ncbi:MAG: hypothetical protein D6723_11195 [Acidobacteria bacterium]|nr:MAG: hypothetical protein D6723_11195 [Acidobacteriota bacterium]
MEVVTYQAPEWLTEDELVELGMVDEPAPALRAKLERLLATPVISNEAYGRGAQPRRPTHPRLGTCLRVAFWNIAQGGRFDEIRWAFHEPEEFIRRIARNALPRRRRRALVEALQQLRTVDLLILNEVDLGLPRSGYRDVARELASVLDMNYAFGVEFVEISPRALDMRPVSSYVRSSVSNGAGDHRTHRPEDETRRLRGLHGNAVLSRYPIRNARVLRFAHQGYDWYAQEKELFSCLPLPDPSPQSARPYWRAMSYCQLRRGGRMALIVEIEVPDLPERRVTVVATHLETRARPVVRRQQMCELLAELHEVTHPVILAGDLNTTGRDATPGAIHQHLLRLMASGEWWSRIAPKVGPALGWMSDFLRGLSHAWLIERDPTHPGVFQNNEERGLFQEVERFRFRDGRCFDFRGDSDRSVNQMTGWLANSNQRSRYGFVPTSESPLAWGPIGRRKLDWMLVKPYIGDPHDVLASYRFAPHFGRTLSALNAGARLSDHHPITVDLPLNEP